MYALFDTEAHLQRPIAEVESNLKYGPWRNCNWVERAGQMSFEYLI
jgi:hypothetical protein